MNKMNELESNLPLTEVTYFILLSLAPGPRHGYGIMKDVRELSQGRVALSTGTLYGALKRMLDQGWIARIGTEDGPQNGRVRKSYRLTNMGERMLSAEARRLEDLVRAARMRSIRQTS